LVDVACERDPQQEREALGPLHKAPGPGKVLGSDPDQTSQNIYDEERKEKSYLSSSRTYIVTEKTAVCYLWSFCPSALLLIMKGYKEEEGWPDMAKGHVLSRVPIRSSPSCVGPAPVEQIICMWTVFKPSSFSFLLIFTLFYANITVRYGEMLSLLFIKYPEVFSCLPIGCVFILNSLPSNSHY
jgi:hypothetical protein